MSCPGHTAFRRAGRPASPVRQPTVRRQRRGRDLLGIWDRACKACDVYIARREFAVGIMLGYFRWHTRADGVEELAHRAGAGRWRGAIRRTSTRH
jgi:hypothetical protein